MIFQKGKKILVDGIFLAIGSQPNSKLFQNQLLLDKQGYILSKDQKTSVEGVYAVGDIVSMYKQAITAAGDGAKVAIQIHQEKSE